MSPISEICSYVGGSGSKSTTTDDLDFANPVISGSIPKVTLSGCVDVETAVYAAKRAFSTWGQARPGERIQYLFKLRSVLKEHFDEISRTSIRECGKTFAESQRELGRGIENVEVAAGIPPLTMGYNSEEVVKGIDELMIRQPTGVEAAITPFNFPTTIPFWFLPYAIACGNALVLKPFEKVPVSMSPVFRLIEEVKIPPWVVSLVHGAKEVVDALWDHPDVRSVLYPHDGV